MRTLIFLSLGAAAAGFSFTGVPSSASANQASSATLIRSSSDPTAFSLLLRLNSQNGGSTIQTFSSEQKTNIPFSFTPTQSGTFIIEVISNLSPISDTQEPDQIYASSGSINVAADSQVSLPSENAGTSSSSQNTNAATSTQVGISQTTSNSIDTTAQVSSITALTSVGASHGTSNGNTVNTATTTQTDSASSISTISLSSPTGSTGQGALASNSSESSTGTSDFESSTFINGASSTSGVAGSTNTSPVSTATLAPTTATSKSSKTGMIIGIVFGILAFVSVCLALLVAYTRHRRRRRTNAFERQLMTRQISPLVFNRTNSSPLSTEVAGSEEGDGYREYVPEEDYSRDIAETGTVQTIEQNGTSSVSHLHSVYSEQSVHSVYSDSPSVFYTAVPAPRAADATSQTSTLLAPSAPIYSASGLTFSPSTNLQPSSLNNPTPSTISSTPQSSTSQTSSALPQLAPGWVFPRAQPRLSQLPPPKTDRQMDIYDRKVRLQGKLIGLQGWGNSDASERQKTEMDAVKEQIQRLEALENSDWALGKSNELPIWGLGLS